MRRVSEVCALGQAVVSVGSQEGMRSAASPTSL